MWHENGLHIVFRLEMLHHIIDGAKIGDSTLVQTHAASQIQRSGFIDLHQCCPKNVTQFHQLTNILSIRWRIACGWTNHKCQSAMFFERINQKSGLQRKICRNVIKKMRWIYPKYPVQRVSIRAMWTEILKINWNKIGLFVSCNPTQSVHGFESYVCLVVPVELCWHQNQWIKLELKLLLELQSKKKSD